MSLLRIFRNLAVLAILTVGCLSLATRPVAAQSTCQPIGAYCDVHRPCCPYSLCAPPTLFTRQPHCCNKPFRGQLCNISAECCSGLCLNHSCR